MVGPGASLGFNVQVKCSCYTTWCVKLCLRFLCLGSPKDRSRVADWDKCPQGYVYPSDDDIVATINKGCAQVKQDLAKPLMRKGSGGQTHTVWRRALEVTRKSPLVLTKIANRKVIAQFIHDKPHDSKALGDLNFVGCMSPMLST